MILPQITRGRPGTMLVTILLSVPFWVSFLLNIAIKIRAISDVSDPKRTFAAACRYPAKGNRFYRTLITKPFYDRNPLRVTKVRKKAIPNIKLTSSFPLIIYAAFMAFSTCYHTVDKLDRGLPH